MMLRREKWTGGREIDSSRVVAKAVAEAEDLRRTWGSLIADSKEPCLTLLYSSLTAVRRRRTRQGCCRRRRRRCIRGAESTLDARRSTPPFRGRRQIQMGPNGINRAHTTASGWRTRREEEEEEETSGMIHRMSSIIIDCVGRAGFPTFPLSHKTYQYLLPNM